MKRKRVPNMCYSNTLWVVTMKRTTLALTLRQESSIHPFLRRIQVFVVIVFPLLSLASFLVQLLYSLFHCIMNSGRMCACNRIIFSTRLEGPRPQSNSTVQSDNPVKSYPNLPVKTWPTRLESTATLSIRSLEQKITTWLENKGYSRLNPPNRCCINHKECVYWTNDHEIWFASVVYLHNQGHKEYPECKARRRSENR